MINHNLLLYSLLDRKFSVEHNGKASVVNYTEGDLYELAAKLNDQSSANQLKYPMIWLQSGYTVQRDKIKQTTKLSGCRFFFIINGDAVMRYEQRYAGNFNAFLYKSMLRFDETIENRSGISANIVDEFKSFPMNDVAELGKGGDKKIPVQDIWDAVEFTTDIEIENECFPEFKINL